MSTAGPAGRSILTIPYRFNCQQLLLSRINWPATFIQPAGCGQCVVSNRLHKLTEQCMWVYSDRGLSCSSVEQPQNSITACGCSIRYHGSYGNRGSIDQRTSLWKATAKMRRSLVVSALNCQPKGQGLHPRQGWQVARIVDTGPPAPDIMNIQE